MEGINLTKLAIAASIEKHGMCRLAYAATEQTMLEAKQAMLEARQAMLEVDEETARLQLVLSTQVNAPLADGSDVTKRVPDDVLELVLRQLTMAELFRAGRVSRRWRLLVGRVSRMWPAIELYSGPGDGMVRVWRGVRLKDGRWWGPSAFLALSFIPITNPD